MTREQNGRTKDDKQIDNKDNIKDDDKNGSVDSDEGKTMRNRIIERQGATHTLMRIEGRTTTL